MKTIGVLGGYGPYATSDFFRMILENTPAKKDWEHLPIIIDCNPRIPSRTRAYLFGEESPEKYMKEGIERLKNAGADFFVCPCNTAHYFLRRMKGEFPIPLLDMIDVVVDEIVSSGIRNIGILGSEVTIQSGIYEKALSNHGINTFYADNIEDVRTVIECGKQNTDLEKGKQILNDLLNELMGKGADGVIYGCTELALVIPSKEVQGCEIFDTGEVLAKKVVKISL